MKYIGKLQTEVRRLQDSLETKRHSRLEQSDSILKDARFRLESVRNAVRGESFFNAWRA